jgi:hypothetical protein
MSENNSTSKDTSVKTVRTNDGAIPQAINNKNIQHTGGFQGAAMPQAAINIITEGASPQLFAKSGSSSQGGKGAQPQTTTTTNTPSVKPPASK